MDLNIPRDQQRGNWRKGIYQQLISRDIKDMSTFEGGRIE
jgi:hypothetical protein